MKKMTLGLICCCFLLALPALSLAASGMYGSVNVGAAWAVDSDVSYSDGSPTEEIAYDAGYTVGGAIGYMMDTFRIEGEISYQANDVDTIDGVSAPPGTSAEANMLTGLINGYLDFDIGGPLTPYITAGIGAARIEFQMTGQPDEDDTVFAYQFGAGVGYAMTDTLTLDFRYRYLGAQDAEFPDTPPDTVDVEVASHNLTVGLRMAF